MREGVGEGGVGEGVDEGGMGEGGVRWVREEVKGCVVTCMVGTLQT